MTTRFIRRCFAVSALVAVAAALVACSEAGAADSRTPGTPSDHPFNGLEFGPTVHLLADGSLAVVTRGSSSCPATATAFENDGESLVVSFSTDSRGVCTADLAATTHTFSADRVGDVVPSHATLSFLESDESYVVEITRR